AFDKGMTCKGFQFEEGKEYVHEGEVKACAGGFHACENPIDMFAYYAPGTSVFRKVEQSGVLSRHNDDSKVASERISIGVQIGIADIVKIGIDYIKSKTSPANA